MNVNNFLLKFNRKFNIAYQVTKSKMNNLVQKREKKPAN